MKRALTILFEQDEDGMFVASVPGIQGCYTQGKTLEEAKNRIQEVIQMCLENEDKELVTKPFPSFIGVEQMLV